MKKFKTFINKKNNMHNGKSKILLKMNWIKKKN